MTSSITSLPTSLLARLRLALTASTQFTTYTNRNGELVVENNAEHWHVVVREHRNGRDHAAIVFAPICDATDASPTRILQLAGQMGAGALALVGNAYVVRYAIPAPQITTAPIETILAYVSALARSVAEDIASAPRADVSTLAHLAM